MDDGCGRGWGQYKGKGYGKGEGWEDCADKPVTIYRQSSARVSRANGAVPVSRYARGTPIYIYILVPRVGGGFESVFEVFEGKKKKKKKTIIFLRTNSCAAK